jgi:hypothetical protein
MADTKHLIAEVAARNGIRLDSDDPAFCLVTLNELVLEGTARRVVENLQGASREFERTAEQIQFRAGSILAKEIRGATADARAEFAANVDAASARAMEKLTRLHQFHRKFAIHWIIAGVIAALVLFGLGVFLGTRLG